MAVGGIVKAVKKGAGALDAAKVERKFDDIAELPGARPELKTEDGVPPFSTQEEVDKALDDILGEIKDPVDDIIEEITVKAPAAEDDFDAFLLEIEELTSGTTPTPAQVGTQDVLETTLIAEVGDLVINDLPPGFLQKTVEKLDVGKINLEEAIFLLNNKAKAGFLGPADPELGSFADLMEEAGDEVVNALDFDFMTEMGKKVDVGLITFEEGVQAMKNTAKKLSQAKEVDHVTVLAQKFLFNPDDIKDHVGEEWAESINLLFEADYLPASTISSGTEAIIKIQKGVDLQPWEQADFDALTEAIEKVDLNIKGIVDEHIDLDEMVVTENSPNSPFDFDKTVGLNTPDYVELLDDRQQDALKLMTHIRGRKFPNVMDDLRSKHYVGVPESLVSQFPKRDDFLQMDPFDVAAVNFYTRSGDGPMNAALRQGKYDPDTDLGKAIDATQAGLDRMPSWDPNDGFLFRRVNDRNLKEVFDNMEDGEEFTELGFTSATRNEVVNVALGQSKKDEILAALTFVIKPKVNGNGKPIEGLSEFLSEKEVLFKHGTKFKLMTRKETENSWGEPVSIIFLEEL